MKNYGRFILVKTVGDGYEVLRDYVFVDPATKKSITLKAGMYSDGATCARDLENTDAWLIHDHICRYAVWDDGGKISNWTASRILSDLLKRDGYKIESFFWRWSTFVFGGGAARKNANRK